MASEASSTTNSRKRKLVDSDVDEVFVLQKKQERTFTKTVSFSIPDLVEKIDENDENIRRTAILTPSFKLGELDFHFFILPECDDEETYDHVGFFINNDNREDVMISMEILEGPTVSGHIFDCRNVKSELGHGWPQYMSHDDYREWATENGDVFKITATVTLHLKEGSTAQWKTLR